jgi:hypothetical protein
MRVVCKENPDSIIKWQVITPSTEMSSKGGSSHTANSGYVSSHGSVQMIAVPPNHPSPPTGYYWQATPLPAPYAPLPLPSPINIPPQHMSIGDSSTLTRPEIYTKPPTSSHDHSDGVRGINLIPIFLPS